MKLLLHAINRLSLYTVPVLMVFTLSLVSINRANADDTDLFQLDSVSAPARVMLVIDTSGSMASPEGVGLDEEEYSGSCSGTATVSVGGTVTEIQNAERKICILKSVLLSFLDPATADPDRLWPDNFEVGLARYSEPGAVILTPLAMLGSISDQQSNRYKLIQAIGSLSAQGRDPLVGSYLEIANYLTGGIAVAESSRQSAEAVWAGDGGYDAYRYAEVDLTPQCGLLNNHVIVVTDGQSDCEKASALTDDERARDACGAESSAVLFGTLGTRVNELVTGELASYNEDSCGADSYSRYLDLPGYESYWGCLSSMSASLQNRKVNGIQAGVKTHVIAYDGSATPQMTLDGMRAWAEHGGGRFAEADNESKLSAALQSFTQDAILPGTFVMASGGVGVSQLNSFSHSNELYFSMFAPNRKPFWYGNLKKYFYSVDSDGEFGIYTDQEYTTPAVSDGVFLPGVMSEWSTVNPDYYNTDNMQDVDGDLAFIGGAASQISKPHNRRLYAYYGNKRYSLAPDDAETEGETIDLLRSALLADYSETSSDSSVPTATGDSIQSMLNWLIGFDVNDEWVRISQHRDPGKRSPTPVDTRAAPYNGIRNLYGAALHASPVLVNYQSRDEQGDPLDSPENVVFISTNDGKLYAIDSDDGTEHLAYLPEAMLKRHDGRVSAVESMFLATRPNAADGELIYGLDSSWSVWRQDVDRDGNIDENTRDFVYLYGGMRRGGRNYYILDATDVAGSKAISEVAVVEGGRDQFEHNGQSWSEPQLAIVNFRGTPAAVFIVGGGYDVAYDSGRPDALPAQGAQVYIVSARDFSEAGSDTLHRAGEVLWWASSRNQAADPTHTRIGALQYSIPSTVKTVDVDGDGYLDFFYVGDMGGQLHRFDINNANSGADDLISNPSDTVIAQLGLAGAQSESVANDRRFFYPPSVAKMRCPEGYCMGVALGSGWRSNPTDTSVQEKFYFLMDYEPFASDQPIITGHATVSKDSTQLQVLPVSRAHSSGTVTAMSVSAGVRGYSLALGGSGMASEKLLGSPLIVGGAAYFSTYYKATEQNSPDSCEVGSGLAAVYSFVPGDAQAVQISRGLNQNVAGSIQALLSVIEPVSGDTSGDDVIPQQTEASKGALVSGTGAIGTSGLPLDRIRKTRWLQLQ